eukprot:TRINITY_DN656_c0_g2_i4.p1 TRINITY_DN656_c0_g2~~TRINITY_DN656_c0_g2_i4.p1  ORF type:complete len:211 (-),score=50.46 TRINITY_DN656_c0_g2_i4:271-903(-)
MYQELAIKRNEKMELLQEIDKLRRAIANHRIISEKYKENQERWHKSTQHEEHLVQLEYEKQAILRKQIEKIRTEISSVQDEMSRAKAENENVENMIENERILIGQLKNFNAGTKEKIREFIRDKEKTKQDLAQSSKLTDAQEIKSKRLENARAVFLHHVESTTSYVKGLEVAGSPPVSPNKSQAENIIAYHAKKTVISTVTTETAEKNVE